MAFAYGSKELLSFCALILALRAKINAPSS
jgi:hypothetical protein